MKNVYILSPWFRQLVHEYVTPSTLALDSGSQVKMECHIFSHTVYVCYAIFIFSLIFLDSSVHLSEDNIVCNAVQVIQHWPIAPILNNVSDLGT